VAKAHRLDAAAALLQAYSASARINQYLVERLHPAVWRTVAPLVAHMHNCALRYLERTAPEVPVPGKLNRHRVTQQQAVRALGAKRKAVLAIVGAAVQDNSKIVGSPHRAAAFLAYYMAHDAHHRGQIVQRARQLGHPISQQTMIGMWQWTARGKE